MPRKFNNFSDFLDFQKAKETARKAHHDEKYKSAIERENRYRNYLRDESQKLREKWQKSAMRAEKRSDASAKGEVVEKTTHREEMYRKFAQMNAEERRRAIEDVEKIIWRDTEKPRELQSAALLGEVLKVQEKQRHEMQQVRMMRQQRRTETAGELLMQSQQWCEEQRQRAYEARRRTAEYKKDLQGLIEERENARRMEREQQMRLEQVLEQMKDEDWTAEAQAHREQERKRRQMVHRHALEAIKIKDDMLKRDKMKDAIHDRMIDLYDEGRKRISNFLQEKAREKCSQREQLKSIIAHQFLEIQPKTEEIEEGLMRRAIADQDENFRRKQEKEREAVRKLKRERFEAQMEDLQCLRARKAQELAERRLSVENRLENFHVTAKHHEMETRERMEAARRHREALDRQVAEKRERERRERQEEIAFTNRIMEEEAAATDTAFGRFSERLVEGAKAKGEPLLPLERAKEAYRTFHSITRRPIPPHLCDRVPINQKSYTGTNW
ncbi:apical junction molecule-like [Lutzomyia longipalpis]|uniref:apical junction molecule-like n=1 Tax=Lutzomyia longipalpis TaxID=7200 RepID=UPI002483349E|nr:apical junction molecule-like [Lutzomyia longipalpis]